MVCAGKTTLAKKLERDNDVVRLSPDEWLLELVTDRNDRANLDRYRDSVERLQWRVAQDFLRRDVDVVLEAGFWRRDERIFYLSQCRAQGFTIELHYLEVAQAQLIARIGRRSLRPQAHEIPIDPQELEEWLTWLEVPTDEETVQYDRFVLHSAS